MAGDAVEEDEAGPSGQGLPQGSSKTDSLAVLLTQALRRCVHCFRMHWGCSLGGVGQGLL